MDNGRTEAASRWRTGLFLDKSKSGRRLWCSDASCGTHTRVKRFRARNM
ncbi:CGNR zinc finger domain-containing protein [Ensifer sp.]|nr:CGNR zinc finger domain-containing protein [Ensifer sp.]